ncbi:carboxyl-terminal processing protease [Kushneria sinocarnis]|uniref:Carboxyl-terminal processing protease n=1 Tax=Kushneria sinocarnis TaxID=595502 RepID=A0A420WVP6_9GAMM|nr:carboxy terminal-processing peptidase [Kushneria sinocarnis]RKR02633.1 carboxyl-terminal processing protease [Kushneria sinocarnis]
MSPFAMVRQAVVFALCVVMALPTLAAEQDRIVPTDNGEQTAQEVAQSLRYSHYEDVSLDQQWSETAWQRMLKMIDPQHAYLLKSDVRQYSDLGSNFSEALENGNLDRLYEFYNLYQKRIENRLQWLLDQLEHTEHFDFEGHDRLATDDEDREWASSPSRLDELWHKRLKNAALQLALSGSPEDSDTRQPGETPEPEIPGNPRQSDDPEQHDDESESGKSEDSLRMMDDQAIISQLEKRYSNQLDRVRQTNSEDVLSVILNAAGSAIDPHTEYFSPSRSESFDIQMKLSLEGIGALLQQDGEYVKISSLVPGGPAEKSGLLKPADRIVAVGQGESGDMTSVVGMRLDEVVDLIRGPKDSTVRLEIIPAKAVDTTQTRIVRITRDTVKLEDQAASSQVIDITRDGERHRIGVIKVPMFYVDFKAEKQGRKDYRSTTRDVHQLIDQLKQKNVEGIVLDLRGNGGGALQEANSMIGLFIDRGPTVQVRDAQGRISLLGDTDRGVAYQGPLAVLVDRLSASASEIFAGAIQDYGRGLVLGNQTFGKGTVQTLDDLDHGELKLTRAKFYRITGASTQLHGVKPDISYPSLVDPDEIGESALPNALPWDTVRPVSYRQYGNPDRYLPPLRQAHQQRTSQDPNFHYLEREAELAHKLREQNNSVSLNIHQRKREMEAQESEQLSLENQRRKALGQEPIDSWADARDGEDDQTPIDQAQLRESANIVLDYAQQLQDSGS